jgi:hypothetical protein
MIIVFFTVYTVLHISYVQAVFIVHNILKLKKKLEDHAYNLYFS